MSQWKINTPALVLLGSLIFVMLLIVVLPDVDLPDAAFNGGTAPVVVHAHATAAPDAVQIGSACPQFHCDRMLSLQNLMRVWTDRIPPNFRPILLRSIRC